MSEESSSKSQKLRDKLSMTLKQRLGLSDHPNTAGDEGSPFGGGDSAIFLTPDQVRDDPNSDDRDRREESFLADTDEGANLAVETMNNAISIADATANDVEASLEDELAAFTSDHSMALASSSEGPQDHPKKPDAIDLAMEDTGRAEREEMERIREREERKRQEEMSTRNKKETNQEVGETKQDKSLAGSKMTEENDKKDGSSLRDLIKGKGGGAANKAPLELLLKNPIEKKSSFLNRNREPLSKKQKSPPKRARNPP